MGKGDSPREDSDAPPRSPMDIDSTEAKSGVEEADGERFQQPTAMFDRGEFLGELGRELKREVGDTRAAVEAEQPPKGCRLIVVTGNDVGLEWQFKQASITIGRGEGNEVELHDFAISRHHARITFEAGKFYAVDLKSNNGTLLNGARLQQREALSSGDELVIGSRTLRFVELTEAPDTSAAHPVRPMKSEPGEGRNSELLPVIESELLDDAKSQLMAAKKSEPDQAARKPAKSNRSLVRGLAIAACVVATVAILKLAHHAFFERGAGKNAQARQYFLQAIELVKARRCGDAIVLLDQVLKVLPEYSRAKEYKAYCDSELVAFEALSTARALREKGKNDDANTALLKVGALSQYYREAHKLLGDSLPVRAPVKVPPPKIPAIVPKREPERVSSRVEKKEPREPREPRTKPEPSVGAIPTALIPAIDLYLDDRIPAAIDAANASGAPEAQSFVDRMETVRRLAESAERVHKSKDVSSLLKLAPEALAADRKVCDRDGLVRARLKKYLADGYYLKAVESYSTNDFTATYDSLSKALSAMPNHELSKARMAELIEKAHELYQEGKAQETSMPTETKRLYSQVIKMTEPSDPIHKQAKDWLKANGGVSR